MRERGYRFVGLDELRRPQPPSRAIALTADDGYASQINHLHPLLRELGIPWSVFVLVGVLGRPNRWDLRGVGLRERHITAGEIRRLSDEGVTIESHGLSHRAMTALTDDELAKELEESRGVLRALSGQEVDAVAYPRGQVDARVARAAARAGYRVGYVLGGRPAESARIDARLRVTRIALYSPDQIPGLFELTALRAPAPVRSVRTGLQRAAGRLIVTALAARRSRDV